MRFERRREEKRGPWAGCSTADVTKKKKKRGSGFDPRS